jgi:cellulose synthase/poly-beta-1,6-N-acetylglucosamine synthase-like glycosyltransferase
VITTILLGIYIVVILLMSIQSLFNIRLRLFIWEEPERATFNRSPEHFIEPTLSFTVLLPARHEEAVIGDTIEKICQANYPRELLQIIVICEASDTATIARVQEKLAQPGKEHVQLIVFADQPINKPHGLNKGLAVATNDVVTIFDAEDDPHTDIFQIVNTTMMNETVEVVQGGVHLMNYHTRWYSPLNVLEYFFWYKSSLHYFGWSGTVPLGGNTVFVRRSLLQELGGWDEHCLTEDADIGIRLSVAGARIRIICDDEHVTREETPPTLKALVRQRTRWNQGFLQVLLKGQWLRLPTFGQRMLAAYVLMGSYIQALFALMLPVSLVTIVLVKLPVWLALLTFLPLYMLILQACVELAGLIEFIRVQKQQISWLAFCTMVLGFFPYQWALAFAALRAVYRQLRHRTDWEKTAHTGIHRNLTPAAASAEEGKASPESPAAETFVGAERTRDGGRRRLPHPKIKFRPGGKTSLQVASSADCPSPPVNEPARRQEQEHNNRQDAKEKYSA